MRKLYFLFVLGVIIVILLLAMAFLFFEKGKHESLIYTTSLNGKNVGYVKADRYKTEDRIIYKSTTFLPKELNCRLLYEKIFFGKKGFQLKKFIRESKNFGPVNEVLYISADDKTFNFLAKQNSKWSTVTGVAHSKDIAIFDETSIITYMPFIDKYDFTKGGAQSFNALYVSSALLPPARGRVVFKSIRDEYIGVEGKKTKTEVLLVRTKTRPQISIWVSKKDRKIVQLEIKKAGLLMRKTTFPPKLKFLAYAPREIPYNLVDTLFPSDDIALAGTLAIPNNEGKLPGILLVTGEGPYTRENAGLHTDISDALARSGFITLRYDKRGMGKSQGDISSVSIADEIKDIENAFKFLSNHEKTDKEKLFIIAHSHASSYLPQLNFSKLPVRGLIMLAVAEPPILVNFECEYMSDKIKEMVQIDNEYDKTLNLLKQQTLILVKDAKKEHIFVQGKYVFAERMKELLSSFKALDGFKELRIPSLVIYGQKDRFGSLQYVSNIEKKLVESGFNDLQVVYFRRLGHFLGELVNEEHRILYYRIDSEVIETIINWITGKAQAPANLPALDTTQAPADLPALDTTQSAGANLTNP